MNIFTVLLRAYFHQKNFRKKVSQKIYVDQDPDPDVFEIRIRIRSKIIQIRNTAYSTTGI
jgi:hypothetical protein